MSFELAVQKTLLDTLRASTDLRRLGAQVFESVPQQTSLPYLTLGDDAISAFDTSSHNGALITAKLHSWSLSRTVIKQMQSAARTVLHTADLSLDPYAFHYCDWVSSQSFIDTDGETRHGVCIYNIYLTEN